MRKIKIFKITLLILFTLFFISFMVIYTYLNSTKPVVKGRFEIKGTQLHGELTIERNIWGVPSLKAVSVSDIFWGIGFVHASDRLFQMDMIRRLSTGRLSEVIGGKTLETDRHYKDLLIEESIERSYQNMAPAVKEIIKSYCEGVNYYIGHENLPPEFKILGYRPEKWTVRDSLSVLKNMETILASSGSELSNFILASIIGRSRVEKLISGFNPSTIISPEELKKFYSNDFLRISVNDEMNNRYNTIGSNNWVISGKKTESKKPILCNDPHLPNVFPSNFYQIYAMSGKFELSGNTIPGIPFVIIGRNNKIGWGLTNVGTDVIDYFILKINPKNSNQYLFDGNWKDFTEIKKIIKVKGEASITHMIKMSAFGPVFEEQGVFLARHSIGLYPSKSMESVYKMNVAKNLEEFLSALRKFTAPAQNVVFADTNGNIGYYPTGKVPIRARGNGLFPLKATSPGDLWKGFYDEIKKPYLINPDKGFIATANNRVLPNGEIPVYSEKWFPSFRAERISQLISSKDKITLKDNMIFQLDTFLPGAKFLIGKIRDLKFKSPGALYVIERLKNWDFHVSSGSDPFLFYRFEHYLAHELFSDNMKEGKNQHLISRHWIYKILGYPDNEIDQNDINYYSDNIETPGKESFRDIVELSLNESYKEFKARGGENKLQWKDIHTLLYKHPLGSVFPLGLFLNRGPYGVSGGDDCIQINAFRDSKNFNTVHLSGFRMVMDFSDFSNSMMINSSGQSGHFMSRFYDDQIELFTHMKYRKMENFGKSKMVLRFIPLKD